MGEIVVVAGAGVSGLTTALLLSRDKSNRVTVVAKHMPGDYDIGYASPFAGANILPMAVEEDSRWETKTWAELQRLAKDVPEAGIHFQKCRVQRKSRDVATAFPGPLFDTNPWYKRIFSDYRDLSPDEVLPGYESGAQYTGVCINTAIYLPWLVGQLLRNGVVLKRATLSHIRDAKLLSHTGQRATVVVNATGLGSLRLEGVKDTKLTPARGQVVLVENESTPMFLCSATDDGRGEEMYLMQRAAGGGTILGGTYDIGNWESQPDPNVALRIMSRIVKARPEIADGKGVAGLRVIRHAVGLRPYRRGGVRIEKERLDEDTWVIHNYGHGGWGYQGSYGCAEDVLALFDEIRRDKVRRSSKL